MGRRRREHPEQHEVPLEKPVPVRLTPDEREGRAHRLAVIGQAIRAHRRELKAKNRDTKGAIEKLEAERAAIEDVLISDVELRQQGELRFGEHEAREALVAVVRVGEAAPPTAPLPSDPHEYVRAKADIVGGPCGICGSEAADPVHDLGAMPSKVPGLTNREAISDLADMVGEVAGPGAAAVMKASGETVFRWADPARDGPDSATSPGEVPPEESVRIAAERVNGGDPPDPAFDFDEGEPAPGVARPHHMIDLPRDEARS